MVMSCNHRAVIVVAAGMLASCETVGENRSLDPGFGESAHYNAALQTIDPEPRPVPGAMMPGGNAGPMGAAIKRYRTDTVKKVDKVTTTETPR